MKVETEWSERLRILQGIDQNRVPNGARAVVVKTGASWEGAGPYDLLPLDALRD
jgi:hypothetical protein